MSFHEERVDNLERAVVALRERVSVLETTSGRVAPPPVPTPRPWTPPPPPPPPPPRPAQPTVPRKPARPSFDLEQLLTGRVLAWAGGLAVFAGLIFFLVTAINRGWIDEPTRVALAFVASTALLLVGYVLHERKGRTQASVATVATGIAGLFAGATTATTIYDLIAPQTGLLVAGLVGAVAAAVAVRWESREIAGLGIVGALLSPVLVGADPSETTLAFMLVALASSTAVLLWMRWDWLAATAFLVSAPQLLLWLADPRPELTIALVAISIFWMIGTAGAIGYELRVPTAELRPSSASLLLANALLMAGAGWWQLDAAGHGDGATLWIIGVAIVHVAIGAGVFGGRISREVALLELAVGIGLSAIGLAMALEGPALVAAWSAEAVLLAWIARRTGIERGYLAATGFLTAAIMHTLAFDAPVDALGGVATGGAITAIVLVTVAAGLMSRIYGGSVDHAREALEVIALAGLAYLVPAITDDVWVPVVWSLLAVCGAEAARRELLLTGPVAGLGYLLLAGAHTMALDAPPSALIDGIERIGDAVLALTALIGATAFASRRDDELRRPLEIAAAILAVYLPSVAIVELSGGGGEPGQTSQVLLSVFWAAVGLAGLVGGLRIGRRDLRIGGLSLLAVAAMKVVIYDLAELDEIFRVLSFIGLGLLLLAGAYAEQRMRQELDSPREDAEVRS